MTCEICDTQTATMWVEQPATQMFGVTLPRTPVMSCDDCGPQLGYETLAPLDTSPDVVAC